MRKKALFFAGGILCLSLAAWAYLLYNKPRKSASLLVTDVTINADSLYACFNNNEQKANQLYLDKIIAVTGIITEVQESEDGFGILLEADRGKPGGIHCTVDKKQAPFPPVVGNKVTIKGKCTGLLIDVNIADASLIYK